MPCPNEPDRASLQVNENTSLQSGVQRREVWSWAMYDFANSGYTTVVITAVFNAYFVSAVAGGAPWATLAWTAALAVSYLIIMVTGPVIGAYADAHAAKKKLLAITTVGCVVCTAICGSLSFSLCCPMRSSAQARISLQRFCPK